MTEAERYDLLCEQDEILLRLLERRKKLLDDVESLFKKIDTRRAALQEDARSRYLNG